MDDFNLAFFYGPFWVKNALWAVIKVKFRVGQLQKGLIFFKIKKSIRLSRIVINVTIKRAGLHQTGHQ
jgi:hypothetical protein